jgi:hypothetical protein
MDETKQIPTVGRIVHFHTAQSEGGPPVIHAAMIVDVINDECVNLAVFTRLGVAYTQEAVRMGGDYGKWSWPERA